MLGEAAEEAGLPPGVLNVVVEQGSEGAVLLTTDPRVDLVTFTGSTNVGRAVATQAAPTLKRVILELGGKSVALHLPDVFDSDAGIGSVVAAASTVFVSHAGQGCALQTRVLVPDEHRAAVAEAIAAAAASFTVGRPGRPRHGGRPAHQRGPASPGRRPRAAGHRRRARCASPVAGAPEHLDRGWFYEPTVLDAPDPMNPANQHEFFGPVLSVLGYRDVDDAVRIANSTEYGLSGGIYTDDLALGMDARRTPPQRHRAGQHRPGHRLHADGWHEAERLRPRARGRRHPRVPGAQARGGGEPMTEEGYTAPDISLVGDEHVRRYQRDRRRGRPRVERRADPPADHDRSPVGRAPAPRR